MERSWEVRIVIETLQSAINCRLMLYYRMSHLETVRMLNIAFGLGIFDNANFGPLISRDCRNYDLTVLQASMF